MEFKQEKDFFENRGNVMNSMRLLAQTIKENESAMTPAMHTLYTVATRAVGCLQDADDEIKEYRVSLEKKAQENEASKAALQAVRATLASTSEGLNTAMERLLRQETELKAIKQLVYAEKNSLEAAQRTLVTQQQEVNMQPTTDATSRAPARVGNPFLREWEVRVVPAKTNLDLGKAEPNGHRSELKQQKAQARVLIERTQQLLERTRDIKTVVSKKHQGASRENQDAAARQQGEPTAKAERETPGAQSLIELAEAHQARNHDTNHLNQHDAIMQRLKSESEACHDEAAVRLARAQHEMAMADILRFEADWKVIMLEQELLNNNVRHGILKHKLKASALHDAKRRELGLDRLVRTRPDGQAMQQQLRV